MTSPRCVHWTSGTLPGSLPIYCHKKCFPSYSNMPSTMFLILIPIKIPCLPCPLAQVNSRTEMIASRAPLLQTAEGPIPADFQHRLRRLAWPRPTMRCTLALTTAGFGSCSPVKVEPDENQNIISPPRHPSKQRGCNPKDCAFCSQPLELFC